MTDAHQLPFSLVLNYIQCHILDQNEVVQLSSLHLIYIKELEENAYLYPDYRCEKLKSCLMDNEINQQITFTKVDLGDEGLCHFHFGVQGKHYGCRLCGLCIQSRFKG